MDPAYVKIRREPWVWDELLGKWWDPEAKVFAEPGGERRPTRRPYASPELRYLGTVADLTRQPATSMLPQGHPAKPFGM